MAAGGSWLSGHGSLDWASDKDDKDEGHDDYRNGHEPVERDPDRGHSDSQAEGMDNYLLAKGKKPMKFDHAKTQNRGESRTDHFKDAFITTLRARGFPGV